MNNKKELETALSHPLKSIIAITELSRASNIEADASIIQEIEHIQKQLVTLSETVSKKIQETKAKQEKPSSIFFNCPRAKKAKWVRKAKSMGTNLTQFLIYAADQACEE